jgi:sulfide dehydrogenase cytochrome subunit
MYFKNKYLKLMAVLALLNIPVVSANPNTLNHPGRTLAANCFQCHGTDGYGLEHLAGESASEIIGELQEMKFESARKEIMNVHAQAYTDAEIRLIADYFAKQPK